MRFLLVGAVLCLSVPFVASASDRCDLAMRETAAAAAMNIGEWHETAQTLKARCEPGEPVTIPRREAQAVASVCDFSKAIVRNEDGTVLCIMANDKRAAN